MDTTLARELEVLDFLNTCDHLGLCVNYIPADLDFFFLSYLVSAACRLHPIGNFVYRKDSSTERLTAVIIASRSPKQYYQTN